MEDSPMELLRGINYWAVVASGGLTFGLGGLWYSSVLFGRAWAAANGYDGERVRQMEASLGPATFGGALSAYLAMALAFALGVELLGVDGLVGGLLLGSLIWAGFVATAGLTVNLFSDRPLRAWGIDAAFQLCFLLMTGAILGAWR